MLKGKPSFLAMLKPLLFFSAIINSSTVFVTNESKSRFLKPSGEKIYFWSGEITAKYSSFLVETPLIIFGLKSTGLDIISARIIISFKIEIELSK